MKVIDHFDFILVLGDEVLYEISGFLLVDIQITVEITLRLLLGKRIIFVCLAVSCDLGSFQDSIIIEGWNDVVLVLDQELQVLLVCSNGGTMKLLEHSIHNEI